MRKKSKERTSCDTCAFYVYDDEYGAYLCDMNMDEDDYVRIMSDRYYQCPLLQKRGRVCCSQKADVGRVSR